VRQAPEEAKLAVEERACFTIIELPAERGGEIEGAANSAAVALRGTP
jgi:hypothetical protein